MIIDKESPRPGQQTFEKMIAGLYLGELFRLVLVDLHEQPQVKFFEGADISPLKKPYSLNASFLSDIEKHLSRIPKHILLGPEPKPTEHNQVVLYNVPASLSVPEAQDNVRKAIVEARQRIRDRQASPLTEPELGGSDGRMRREIPDMEDGDAMDID